MHVMMPVNASRCPSVKALEFVKLCAQHVIERASETGVEYNLGKAVPQQVLRKALLMGQERLWNSRRRKGRREIDVQTGISFMIAGDCSGALRIFHEDHCAYG